MSWEDRGKYLVYALIIAKGFKGKKAKMIYNAAEKKFKRKNKKR